MESLINLFVLLGSLSVAAERLANIIKLRSPTLRHSRRVISEADEKDRERRIASRVLAVSILLAVALRADLFAILSHLDAPWDTLGWSRGPTPLTAGSLTFTICGSILTGIALGFGSKFWHDVLDTVHGVRRRIRKGADNDLARSPEFSGRSAAKGAGQRVQGGA